MVGRKLKKRGPYSYGWFVLLYGGNQHNIVKQLVCVCLVAQLRPTLYDLVDCSPPGFSVHGVSGILDWVAIPFSGVGEMVVEIFPTQESNLGLLHCRWVLCHLSYQGSPKQLSSNNNNNKIHQRWKKRDKDMQQQHEGRICVFCHCLSLVPVCVCVCVCVCTH